MKMKRKEYEYYEPAKYREGLIGKIQKRNVIVAGVLSGLSLALPPYFISSDVISFYVVSCILVQMVFVIYMVWANNEIDGGKDKHSFIDRFVNYWKGICIKDDKIVVFTEENSNYGRSELKLDYVNDIEIIDSVGERSSVLIRSEKKSNIIANTKNPRELYNTIILEEI